MSCESISSITVIAKILLYNFIVFPLIGLLMILYVEYYNLDCENSVVEQIRQHTRPNGDCGCQSCLGLRLERRRSGGARDVDGEAKIEVMPIWRLWMGAAFTYEEYEKVFGGGKVRA